jgi:AcrR family transcriptional regulator
MTRLAENRDTHLTPAEIAAEALRQFDAGGDEPSIRGLARSLNVAPSAIYHHYGSRAEIVQAAVELVWAEAVQNLLNLVPKPFEEDPEEVLVAVGIATRRAWLAHHRIAPYVAATPEGNETIGNSLALMANILERLGLDGEDAAKALHSYASFMIGAVLFAALRETTNENLAAASGNGRPREPFHAQPEVAMRGRSSKRTRLSIDEVMDLSVVDPQRDEELFAAGLRDLVASLR